MAADKLSFEFPPDVDNAKCRFCQKNEAGVYQVPLGIPVSDCYCPDCVDKCREFYRFIMGLPTEAELEARQARQFKPPAAQLAAVLAEAVPPYGEPFDGMELIRDPAHA